LRSGIDETEFTFDFELINTTIYRKAFYRKIMLNAENDGSSTTKVPNKSPVEAERDNLLAVSDSAETASEADVEEDDVEELVSEGARKLSQPDDCSIVTENFSTGELRHETSRGFGNGQFTSTSSLPHVIVQEKHQSTFAELVWPDAPELEQPPVEAQLVENASTIDAYKFELGDPMTTVNQRTSKTDGPLNESDNIVAEVDKHMIEIGQSEAKFNEPVIEANNSEFEVTEHVIGLCTAYDEVVFSEVQHIKLQFTLDNPTPLLMERPEEMAGYMTLPIGVAESDTDGSRSTISSTTCSDSMELPTSTVSTAVLSELVREDDDNIDLVLTSPSSFSLLPNLYTFLNYLATAESVDPIIREVGTTSEGFEARNPVRVIDISPCKPPEILVENESQLTRSTNPQLQFSFLTKYALNAIVHSNFSSIVVKGEKSDGGETV
jgi:hypothetical protein